MSAPGVSESSREHLRTNAANSIEYGEEDYYTPDEWAEMKSDGACHPESSDYEEDYEYERNSTYASNTHTLEESCEDDASRVLFRCVWVTVFNLDDSRQQQKLLAIFDEASNSSYIRTRSSDKLQLLPLSKGNGSLRVFDTAKEATKEITLVRLGLRTATGETFQIKAKLSDHMTGRMRYAQVTDAMRNSQFKSLDMVTAEYGEPDLLIGLNYEMELMTGRPEKIHGTRLYYQSTLLGPILGGVLSGREESDHFASTNSNCIITMHAISGTQSQDACLATTGEETQSSAGTLDDQVTADNSSRLIIDGLEKQKKTAAPMLSDIEFKLLPIMVRNLERTLASLAPTDESSRAFLLWEMDVLRDRLKREMPPQQSEPLVTEIPKSHGSCHAKGDETGTSLHSITRHIIQWPIDSIRMEEDCALESRGTCHADGSGNLIGESRSACCAPRVENLRKRTRDSRRTAWMRRRNRFEGVRHGVRRAKIKPERGKHTGVLPSMSKATPNRVDLRRQDFRPG